MLATAYVVEPEQSSEAVDVLNNYWSSCIGSSPSRGRLKADRGSDAMSVMQAHARCLIRYWCWLQVYERSLRKGLRADVMLYLARAHYDADRMLDARQTLVRAIHAWPNDLKLRFNLGVTLQVPRDPSQETANDKLSGRQWLPTWHAALEEDLSHLCILPSNLC